MKKIIALLILLTPSFAFAQIIPGDWPTVIYCKPTSEDYVGGVFPLYQVAIPGNGLAGNVEYRNIAPTLNNLNPQFSQVYAADRSWTSADISSDCDNASIQDLVSNNQAFYFVRSSSPIVLPDSASKRKSADESVSSNTVLHDDTQLSVALKNGKTYEIHGQIFASSANATPDIKVALTAPAGSDMAIGYTSTAGAGSSGVLVTSGTASARIPLPANTPVPVTVDGTIVAGADGALQLQWAQFASNAAAVKVGKGSYLRVTEITN